MKNTLHTPGPWRVVHASAHEFNPETTRKDIIGKCQFGDAYVAGDISANDARLIASAPDLLDALHAIIDAFGHQDSLLMDQCKAAVAKATA